MAGTNVNEVEIKKPGPGILKTSKLKSSFKKKALQNISQGSDDNAIEPLLKTEEAQKPKVSVSNNSAKPTFNFNRLKTEKNEKDCSKEKLLQGEEEIDGKSFGRNIENGGETNTYAVNTTTYDIEFNKGAAIQTQYSTTKADDAINANYVVFNEKSAMSDTKTSTALKDGKSSQAPVTSNESATLVNVTTVKYASNVNPVIFTTAKIHTENKNNTTQPFQAILVPIPSAAELSKPSKSPTNLKQDMNINPVLQIKDKITHKSVLDTTKQKPNNFSNTPLTNTLISNNKPEEVKCTKELKLALNETKLPLISTANSKATTSNIGNINKIPTNVSQPAVKTTAASRNLTLDITKSTKGFTNEKLLKESKPLPMKTSVSQKKSNEASFDASSVAATAKLKDSNFPLSKKPTKKDDNGPPKT